jgi:hypothetical protein
MAAELKTVGRSGVLLRENAAPAQVLAASGR